MAGVGGGGRLTLHDGSGGPVWAAFGNFTNIDPIHRDDIVLIFGCRDTNGHHYCGLHDSRLYLLPAMPTGLGSTAIAQHATD